MPPAHQEKPTQDDVVSYYDGTTEQRVRNYVYGNRRIEAAAALVRSRMSRSVAKVLEVGCGLGITAADLVQRYPWVTVQAVDISPRTIAAAARLFGTSDRLAFEVSDMRKAPSLAPFDLITLLDVYEHIPREDRPRLHSVLAQSLAERGALVLTLPSPTHQAFLAEHKPSGLQVVDETVQLEDLSALAESVDGKITDYKMVSIWNRYDYMHCVIDRDLSYRTEGAALDGRPGLLQQALSRGAAWLRPLEVRRRRRAAMTRLEIRV